MSDSSGLLIGLGVVAVGAAAIYYLVLKNPNAFGLGGGGTAPVNVGDCTTGPNGFDCMKVSCKGVSQVICSNNASYRCADIRRDAQGLCSQYMPPGGGGGGTPGSGGCVSIAAATSQPYDGRVVRICDPTGSGYGTCILGTCNGKKLSHCLPGAADYAGLKALLQLDCGINPRTGGNLGGGGTPAARPCVTDCACVQGRNPNIGTLCPAGARSCTACWRRQGTTTPCTPSGPEKSAYGFSCAPSTGQPTVLFTHQTTYNRVFNNPSDQSRLVIS